MGSPEHVRRSGTTITAATVMLACKIVPPRRRLQPSATPPEVVAQVEQWRRERRWSASRIAFELNGEDNHKPPLAIVAKRPGHMVHLDVMKVGRIPDGGGWRVHGRDSEQTRAASRTMTKTSHALLGEHRKWTRPYTPRYNGKVERYN
jgi:hypothetical protein